MYIQSPYKITTRIEVLWFADYLSVQPPAATLELHESPFGLGIVYNRLTISIQNARMNFVLSPTLLLSFVEGVLGYKPVFGDGGTWTLRRDVGFKS
jgi:hypothetical protein